MVKVFRRASGNVFWGVFLTLPGEVFREAFYVIRYRQRFIYSPRANGADKIWRNPRDKIH